MSAENVIEIVKNRTQEHGTVFDPQLINWLGKNIPPESISKGVLETIVLVKSTSGCINTLSRLSWRKFVHDTVKGIVQTDYQEDIKTLVNACVNRKVSNKIDWDLGQSPNIELYRQLADNGLLEEVGEQSGIFRLDEAVYDTFGSKITKKIEERFGSKESLHDHIDLLSLR